MIRACLRLFLLLLAAQALAMAPASAAEDPFAGKDPADFGTACTLYADGAAAEAAAETFGSTVEQWLAFCDGAPGLTTPAGPAETAAGVLPDSALTQPIKDAAGAVDGAADAIDNFGQGWLADLAEGLADATEAVVKETMTWWLATDSIDLANAGTAKILALTTGIAWIVLIFIVIWQGMRTAFTRSGKPVGEMFQGLIVGTLVLGAASVILPLALLVGDELTDWILAVGLSSGTGVFDGQSDPGSGQGRADLLSAALLAMVVPTNASTGVVLVILITLVAVLFGLFHALMLFLKQTAFPILQVMLPVAAVGMAGGESTRRWLPTVLSSMLAIILYKPIVALILVLGLAMFGESSTVVDAARGLVILALSVFALPVLVKMFTPFAARLSGGTGLGAVLGGGLAMAGAGAMYASRDTAPGTQSASTLDAQTTAELTGGSDSGSGSAGGAGLAADVKAANQGTGEGSGGDAAGAASDSKAGAAGVGSDPALDGAAAQASGDAAASGAGMGTTGGADGSTDGAGAAEVSAAGAPSGGSAAASGSASGSAASAAASGGTLLAAQAAAQAAQTAGSAASGAVDTSAAEVAAADVAREEGTTSGGGDRA